MKDILITGGAGFIGSNIAIKLISKGYRVRVLDNLSKQIHGEDPYNDSYLYKSIKDKVDFIEGSVTSKEDWLKAIEGQDAVIHLAAETGTGQSMYEIEKYCNVNIMGTAILLDILSNNKHKVSKIIVASSRAIYGEGKYYSNEFGFVYPESRQMSDLQNRIFEVTYNHTTDLILCATDELSKIAPSSVYGISKQVQEQLVLTVCKSIGIKCIAFRYQNVYGPGQSLTNPYTGILSIFSTRILNGQSINIFEDGLESRDFVFIDDVVNATIAGIENDIIENEIFNVGTGRAISVKEVVDVLIKHYNRKVDVKISGNYRVGDIRHNYADIEKINKKLNFTPKITFEEGIGRYTEWVLQQPIKENFYEKSLEEMRQKGLLN
jgi:dTDP-L-rhamnose 4-epimerase